MSRKLIKVAIIEWADAASARGWATEKAATEEDSGLSLVISIGILVAQDKQSVSISTSLDQGGKFVDILSIPRAGISRITFREEKIP